MSQQPHREGREHSEADWLDAGGGTDDGPVDDEESTNQENAADPR